MRWLEHKLPPPIVAAILGLAMWAVARITPRIQVEQNVRIAIAIALVLSGIVVALLGAAEFRKAKTTLNAFKPEASSALVVTGIYRHSRNPMYLGVVCVLLAWAVYLAAPFALLGPVLFVLFITRFQIVPEERALSAKFGPEFIRYTGEVRRWL